MDQDGSFVAVGLEMPDLTQSPELDNMVDPPESVTITADAAGFVVPDITTMASNQVLDMVGDDGVDDLDSNLDGMLSQASSIQEATEQLS